MYSKNHFGVRFDLRQTCSYFVSHLKAIGGAFPREERKRKRDGGKERETKKEGDSGYLADAAVSRRSSRLRGGFVYD